jgi:hypothetical protein
LSSVQEVKSKKLKRQAKNVLDKFWAPKPVF